MPRNQGWFRVYDRNIDSPQMLELSLAERGLLMGLWSLASSAPEGYITYTARQLRRRLFIEEWTESEVQQAIDKLVEIDLMQRTDSGLKPSRWDQHQHNYPSDSREATAARKRKQRENEQDAVTNAAQNDAESHVTSMSLEVTTREKNRIEKNRYRGRAEQSRADAPAQVLPAMPAASHALQNQTHPTQNASPQKPVLPAPDIPGAAKSPPAYVAPLKAQGFTLEEIRAAYDKATARGQPITDPVKLFARIITEDFRSAPAPTGLAPPPLVDAEEMAKRAAIEAEREKAHREANAKAKANIDRAVAEMEARNANAVH